MLCSLMCWTGDLARKPKNSTVNSSWETPREATTWKTEKKIGGLHWERYRARYFEVWLCVCGNGSELFPKAGFLMNGIRHFDSSVNKSPGYEAKIQVVYRTNARPLFIIVATLYKQRLRHVRVACMLLLNGFVYVFFLTKQRQTCPALVLKRL